MKYVKAESEIIEFSNEDIITTSGVSDSSKPGWGYGAGGHTGPPGLQDKPDKGNGKGKH